MEINMSNKTIIYDNIQVYTSDIGSDIDSDTDLSDDLQEKEYEDEDICAETNDQISDNIDKTDKTELLDSIIDKYDNTLSVQDLNNILIEGTIRRIVKYCKIHRVSSLAVKELSKLYNNKIIKLIQLLKPCNNVIKKDNLDIFPHIDKEKTNTRRYTLSDDSDIEEDNNTIMIFCSPKRFRHIVNTHVSYRWNPSVLLHIQYYVELFIVWMIRNAEITRSMYNKKTLDSQTILYAIKIVS